VWTQTPRKRPQNNTDLPRQDHTRCTEHLLLYTGTGLKGLTLFQQHTRKGKFRVSLPVRSSYLSEMKQPPSTDFAATVQLLLTTFNKLNDTDLRILVYLSRARIALNCVICKHLSLDPSYCHRRLRLLMAAGLVEMERVAKRKIYRLSVQRFRLLGVIV
jgi:hypothetical protein